MRTVSSDGVVVAPGRASLVSPADKGLLRKVWQRFWRQKLLFCVILLLALLLTAFITWVMTPQYKAVSMIQIERPDIHPVESVESVESVDSSHAPSATPGDQFFPRTYYEQLKSRELAQQVIHELRLEEVLFGRDFGPPLKTLMQQQFDAILGPLVAWAKGLSKTPDTAAVIDPVDQFLQHLHIEPVMQSNLVKVFYQTPDAELSAKIVNTLVKAFIAKQRAAKRQPDVYTQNFLELELDKARDRMNESEAALLEYSREHNILAADNNQEAQEARLADLNNALVVAERQKIDAESAFSRVESGADAVAASPLVTRLQQQLTALEARYNDQLQTLKPDNPDMRQRALEIAEVRRELTNARTAARRSTPDTLRAASEAAAKRVEALSDELADYEDELLDLRGRSVEYNALRRDLEINRKLYNDLVQRDKTAGTVVEVGGNYIRVIDTAQPPVNSVSPNMLRNMLLGLFVGLLLASLFVLLREAFRNTLASAAELTEFSGLPVLGTVPYVRRARQVALPLAALRDIGSAVAEAYRITAANLKFALDVPGSRLLLVTSVNPAAGKSTSSVNLALSHAQLGNKVLLIDADFRRPTIHSKMQIHNHLGLSEYLYGDIELAKATQHFSEGADTFVITAGLVNLDPVEALSCERMLRLIEKSRQYFDVVIIDAPPVTGFADTLLLAEYADGVVLVTDEEGVDRDHMADTLGNLQRVKDNVLGFLVVKSRKAAVSEDYYQRYQRRQTADDTPATAPPRGGLNLAR